MSERHFPMQITFYVDAEFTTLQNIAEVKLFKKKIQHKIKFTGS